MHLPVRWREVRAAGIAVVHQDLGLLDQLTVAENICVGGFPTARVTGRIDRARRDELAARTLDRLGVDLHPATLVGTLSAPERAEVAIARAMRDHDTARGSSSSTSRPAHLPVTTCGASTRCCGASLPTAARQC